MLTHFGNFYTVKREKDRSKPFFTMRIALRQAFLFIAFFAGFKAQILGLIFADMLGLFHITTVGVAMVLCATVGGNPHHSVCVVGVVVFTDRADTIQIFVFCWCTFGCTAGAGFGLGAGCLREAVGVTGFCGCGAGFGCINRGRNSCFCGGRNSCCCGRGCSGCFCLTDGRLLRED